VPTSAASGSIDSEIVRKLIEDLYAAFDEPNDLLTDPVFSPDREAIVREAVRHDRRALPPRVLDDIAYHLVTTIGGPQTLRHYLPRIFEEELLAGSVDLEWPFLTYKLERAGFRAWPPEQRRLVLAAVKLWLGREIMTRHGVSEEDFPELAAGALLARTPVATLLDMLDPTRGHAAPWSGDEKEAAFLIAVERELGSGAEPSGS
jgi:hypothetical protein